MTIMDGPKNDFDLPNLGCEEKIMMILIIKKKMTNS